MERVYNFDKNKRDTDKQKIKIDSTLLDYKLSFSFKYISLKRNILCFNNNQIKINQYFDLIEYIGYLSDFKISDFINSQTNEFKFHDIDLDKKYFLKPIINKLLKINKSHEIPTIYSIKACIENNYKENISPRLIGYLSDYGVFNLLFLDFYHVIYSNHESKENYKNWINEYNNIYNI